MLQGLVSICRLKSLDVFPFVAATVLHMDTLNPLPPQCVVYVDNYVFGNKDLCCCRHRDEIYKKNSGQN
jgi:hypothetical protein